MYERRDPFQAIADPRRREILALLSQEALSVNQVARHFNISRPAISKHLKILQECGLISFLQVGRERYCQAELAQLQPVAEWLLQYQNFWNQRLNTLEDMLRKEDESKNDNDHD